MTTTQAAYVVGTWDTKGEELAYASRLLEAAGIPVVGLDLSTGAPAGPAEGVGAAEVAAHHPRGAHAVLDASDRGEAVSAMAEAFARWSAAHAEEIGGMLGLGGSGGTALIAPGMRALGVGVPKLLVSTVASGDVSAYVGPCDIAMLYSVTDVAGLNRISRRVIGNAAHGLAGMMQGAGNLALDDDRPALALSMFGVTTPCVTYCTGALKERWDCLTFHATGTGGRSLEKLAASGLVEGILDVTLTEVCDLFAGGIMSAGEERLDVLAERELPWVGSVGALDMVNFAGRETVPERYAERLLHIHNPQITLMRTTPRENAAMGEWIAAKLNRARGPLRLCLPEGGVSALDAPGQPFHDPEADAALFDAIEANFRQDEGHRLLRFPLHINDEAFAAALVENLLEIL